MSASPRLGSAGGLSGKPFFSAKPENASTSVPKPGRAAYGPVWPQPEMRTITSFGLTACSAAGDRP